MSNMIIFVIILIGLLAIGMPIFVALGAGAMVLMYLTMGLFSSDMLMQQMFNGADSFTLMAIPLFMLTGELMNHGGISKRLVDFSASVVGWVRGGLGFVVVLTCCFLAAILGSSSACSAMVGVILIPAMVEHGYDKDFSSALVAAAGGVGPIIPPSALLLVYGVTASQSVNDLFLAGYAPGIFIGILFCIYCYIIARRRGYPAGPKPTLKSFFKSLWNALIPLALPVIIMGCILSGACTATEAAMVAVIYSFIVSLFVYREVHLKDVPGIILKAARSTCLVLAVMSTAAFLSYTMSLARIPNMVGDMILSFTDSRIVFLLLCNLVLIITGMFLEATSAVVILTPVLLPVAQSLGVDPIYFGVMMVTNLMIGVLTPPVGLNLYVTSSIADINIMRLSKAVLPFIFIMILFLVLTILVPDIITFLPHQYELLSGG